MISHHDWRADFQEPEEKYGGFPLETDASVRCGVPWNVAHVHAHAGIREPHPVRHFGPLECGSFRRHVACRVGIRHEHCPRDIHNFPVKVRGIVLLFSQDRVFPGRRRVGALSGRDREIHGNLSVHKEQPPLLGQRDLDPAVLRRGSGKHGFVPVGFRFPTMPRTPCGMRRKRLSPRGLKPLLLRAPFQNGTRGKNCGCRHQQDPACKQSRHMGHALFLPSKIPDEAWVTGRGHRETRCHAADYRATGKSRSRQFVPVSLLAIQASAITFNHS